MLLLMLSFNMVPSVGWQPVSRWFVAHAIALMHGVKLKHMLLEHSALVVDR
jgi:hypothetical protein